MVGGLGQKKYLAGYLFKFIHTQNNRDLAAISTLSKVFRAQLAEQMTLICPRWELWFKTSLLRFTTKGTKSAK